MLTALIYLSQQNIPFDVFSFKKLSEKAHQNNNLVNVTGFLSCKNGVFFQYLEGDLNNINYLFKKIEQDERHQIYYKFYFSKVKERIFNGWGMKYYIYNERNHFDHDNLVRDILEIIQENKSLEDRFEMELIENLKYIRKNLHKHLPHLE